MKRHTFTATGRIVGPPIPTLNPGRPRLAGERVAFVEAEWEGGFCINYRELELQCLAWHEQLMFRARAHAWLNGQKIEPFFHDQYSVSPR